MLISIHKQRTQFTTSQFM